MTETQASSRFLVFDLQVVLLYFRGDDGEASKFNGVSAPTHYSFLKPPAKLDLLTLESMLPIIIDHATTFDRARDTDK